MNYAKDFFDIPIVMEDNSTLRKSVIELISTQPMHGKAIESDDRLNKFRKVLISLVNGIIKFDQAYLLTEQEIPRNESVHLESNQVFAKDWGERIVRTQISRFYNQAVLEELIENEKMQCFIPHSEFEKPNSKCSIELAGNKQDVKMLYKRLIESYGNGNYTREVKIPNHPHCTHVVSPIIGN